MMGDLRVHLSILLSVQQFLTKNGMNPMLHPPYSLDLTPRDFFLFPQMKKVLKGKFCQCGRGKTKNGRSTKRHQNPQVQNCFEQWEKILMCVLHQMEGTLNVTKV